MTKQRIKAKTKAVKTSPQQPVESSVPTPSTQQEESASEIEVGSYQRERPQRRKVYQRPSESEIPPDVTAKFAKEGYELRMIRWAIKGDIDYRYLNRREQEGYEFVTADELPESFRRTLRIRDTQITKGLVTNGGDLCLMKIDMDLRRSREQFFAEKALNEQRSVDVNVLEKRGLRNTGTRSKVVLREPSFGD